MRIISLVILLVIAAPASAALVRLDFSANVAEPSASVFSGNLVTGYVDYDTNAIPGPGTGGGKYVDFVTDAAFTISNSTGDILYSFGLVGGTGAGNIIRVFDTDAGDSLRFELSTTGDSRLWTDPPPNPPDPVAPDNFKIDVFGPASLFSNSDLPIPLVPILFDVGGLDLQIGLSTPVLLRANADVSATLSTINPVPLPAAAWLFGSALMGLIGLSRRRKTT